MNIEKSNNIFIGIEGGATNTNGVLFDSNGNTLAALSIKGSNLAVYQQVAAERICFLIQELIKKARIDSESIKCIGLGIAGSSNEDGRDLLFKELDKINLSNKTLLSNDAEAAYQVCCPKNEGLLITVGTGVICIARNQSGKLFRTAGKGHHSGDIGSGFWIASQAIIKLSMQDEISLNNPADSKEILDIIYKVLEIDNLDDDLDRILKSSEAVREVASLSKYIINLANENNEVALSIIQEATTAISDYIIELIDKLGYESDEIILAANGSIMKNKFFRKALNDALQFDFSKINWIVSKVSPAYGAAILAAKYKNINLKISDIIKGSNFESNS